MKKRQQLRSMFLLLFIAVLGSTWGAQRAHADIVSEFTGTWYTAQYGLDGFYRDQSSIGPVVFEPFGADGLHEGFFFSSPVTDGTLDPGCNSWPCGVSWSGTFVGGTMNMYIDTDAFGPTFTATITGGSYSGDEGGMEPYYPWYSAGDGQTFTFTSAPWGDDWTSTGTFTGGFGGDGAIFGGEGTLTMTTTTAPTTVPEPGGITLLGTGMVLLVASLRLRLRNSPLAP
jgi:hypothetical protein